MPIQHYGLLKTLPVWFLCLSILACSSNSKGNLSVVSYSEFHAFVSETGYVTDAEKFGWSVVQQDVYNFLTIDSANWRKPDGKTSSKGYNLPVTQVSYNDALAYCEWSGTELPTYTQYWELVKKDDRKIIVNGNGPISPVDSVNVLGNVWEITSPENGKGIRLAGGSLFCSKNTCDGTSIERELYIDKHTGNLHIGFAVVR